jgi:histidinol dehydrogenase
MGKITEIVLEGTVTRHERTRQVVINSQFGEDPRIDIVREAFAIKNGVIIDREMDQTMTKWASQIAPEKVTLADGTELSAAQVYEAIALFGDKWFA